MGCIGGDLSASLVMSKSQLLLGSLNMVVDHEAKLPPKQGIVSILGSDSSTRPAASLRRTLSADMLSKTWLSQNGLISNMKKIASSEELSRCISPSSAGEEEEETPAEELDIWSLIVSQSKNNKDQDKSAAPYIHPLVKKSAGALSKTSLEVCTESLGSETGSDGFSSHPSSEMGDTEEEQPQEQQQSLDYEDVRVVKYNFTAVGKKLPPPSFPPPLASRGGDEPSLRMKSRRENGRLVLEAVSVSKQNNFKAERQDGRLVLTFANAEAMNYEEAMEDEKEEGMLDEMEEYFGQSSDDDEEEEDYDDEETEDEVEEEEETTRGRGRGREIEIIQKPRSGVIKLHRLALMSASIATMYNPTCPHKYNQVIQFGNEEGETPLAKTLPPVRPLNAYEYCWRDKPTAAQAMEKNSDNKHMISKNNSSIVANNDQHQQELVVNYIVPNLKGCKEHRRSLFREPYCIATS